MTSKAAVLAGVFAAALSATACAGRSGSVGPSTATSSLIARTPTSAATRHLVGMPHPERAGFAVIGHGYSAVVAAGAIATGAAWSTIKVPLSIAALKHGGSPADVALAIEASENAPADRLWASLGDAVDAGRLTQAEIVSGGDAVTRVETKQTYPPYSPYGQTMWALVDQARFASTLSCRADAAAVYADMGRIKAVDRVGFGTTASAPGAHYKIGWGPAAPPERGSYARELATITLADGRTYGVALIAKEPTLAAAQADLNDLAAWLEPRLTAIPAKGC